MEARYYVSLERSENNQRVVKMLGNQPHTLEEAGSVDRPR